MGTTAAQRERIIAELAGRQRGVVTASQLRAAGFDQQAIKRRLRAGRLHRLHRGVYLAGHPVSPDGAAELAAVLACGAGSVVSHQTSARLWRLPAFLERTGPIHVTVAGRDARHRPGIVVHRVRALAPPDVRHVDGIPATSPARTLLDLASLLPLHDLELTLADARALRLVTDRDLAEVLERAGTGRGAGALRRLLELERSHGLSRSEAERRLFTLVQAAALPLPKKNARVGRLQVDFLWRREKVVVEVDGYAYHSSKRAFERDRERDAQLAAHGHTVIRVTWRQLRDGAEAVVARIAAALAVRSV
ncbi:MAG TPA: type IV toxin-antitoxin system AbiEi family antitoxin domain-containing protein [Longimicrobiales bacterium]